MTTDASEGSQEAFLRTAVDSLPVLISYLGADERYRFANKAYSDWFGAEADHIVGQTMAEFLGPAAYANVKPWVQAVLRGEPVSFESTAPYRHGSARHISATYAPDLDDAGRAKGFFVLVQDITPRKRTEEALARTELSLSAVLESVSDGFQAIDSEGCVTLLNAASEAFFGVSRGEVLGRPLFDVFPGLLGSAFEPMIRAALAGSRPPPVEAPSVRRPERRVLARAAPLDGGGCALVFTDVTDRFVAETERRASDLRAREQLEELEAIYETSPVGLAFLSTDLRFIRVNRRLAEMNGHPAADHIGRTVRDLVPNIADQVGDILRRLQAGEDVVCHEVTGETAAQPGVQRTWLEYWTPLRGVGGEVRGLNVVVEEISERKHAEARTRLLIDELNHRVKNTLSVVQNLARQSFRDAGSPAAKAAFEERLLALAAAHNVLTQRKWEPASLREVAATAIADAGDRIELAGPDVAVGADLAVALSLALHELTTNARKYGALSNDSGRILLAWTRDPDGRVRLRWTEGGGPVVSPPARRGFGARLLERAMDGATGGEAALAFPPMGVICELAFRTDEPGKQPNPSV